MRTIDLEKLERLKARNPAAKFTIEKDEKGDEWLTMELKGWNTYSYKSVEECDMYLDCMKSYGNGGDGYTGD